MSTDLIHNRFELALQDANLHEALHTLAESLKSSGLGQVEMYRLYAEYLYKTDGSDPRYEAIVDTMDLIWGGPWAKGRALFEKELTDADVHRPPP